jgi:ABC-type multidrug transport system permease subunit
MEQSPLLLKLLGYVSPLRYAADGITKSLSGQTDVWFELAVLAGFALVTMALGTWRLPWRED